MWDRIFLSRASISTLGIQQHLFIAEAAQEFRREHLRRQHIGFLSETVFKVTKEAAELKKACGFVPFQSENQDHFRKWRRRARRNRTGIVPPRHVIWRWALLWLESHRSCKPYHTKRPPPHLYYIQKPMRNQPRRPRLCIRPFMMRTTRISST